MTKWTWTRKTPRPKTPWRAHDIPFDRLFQNGVLEYASTLVMLKARFNWDYRAGHAPSGTLPRRHSHQHNDGPGTVIRGRLVRGRFA